jgi:hypothetical protein
VDPNLQMTFEADEFPTFARYSHVEFLYACLSGVTDRAHYR